MAASLNSSDFPSGPTAVALYRRPCEAATNFHVLLAALRQPAALSMGYTIGARRNMRGLSTSGLAATLLTAMLLATARPAFAVPAPAQQHLPYVAIHDPQFTPASEAVFMGRATG